jgi:hypothetical protein
MAEYAVSIKTLWLIARDVYFVSRATYNTIQTARHRDEQLEDLQRQYFEQVSLIAAFAQIFLNGLPEKQQGQPLLWLPRVRRIYKELQRICHSDHARLALDQDPEYREFDKFYTSFLKSNRAEFVIKDRESQQWLIEAPELPSSEHANACVNGTPAQSSTSAVSAPKNSMFSRFMDVGSRLKFAVWDKKMYKKILGLMKIQADELLQLVPIVQASHPNYMSSTAQFESLLSNAAFRILAASLGVQNHRAIQQISEIRDDENNSDTTDADEALKGVDAEFEDLIGCELEPAQCQMLSDGWLKDENGVIDKVLIEYKEWRVTNSPNDLKKSQKELYKLGCVLAAAKPKFFPTLNLRGYINQEAQHRYAFVFDFPEDSVKEQPLVLQKIISVGKSMKGASTITNKFAMAQRLARCVSAFHADNWVHESICSESVVIFKDSSSQPVYHTPYLVNFEFSRPAGEETTWQATKNSTRDLYVHPERLGKHPERFQREHDLYSLGVVFLEIGVWKTASTIFAERSKRKMKEVEGQSTESSIDVNEAKQIFLEVAKDDLPEAMGVDYAEAVVSLISQVTVGRPDDAPRTSQTILSVIENVEITKMLKRLNAGQNEAEDD